MARPERPLDIDAGPLAQFAGDLRKLRQAAGGMPYREMTKSARYSATVLSEAACGKKLPTLEATLAYVRACGGDEDEWRDRWRTVAEHQARECPGARGGGSSDSGRSAVDRAGAGGPPRRLANAPMVAMVALLVGFVLGRIRSAIRQV